MNIVHVIINVWRYDNVKEWVVNKQGFIKDQYIPIISGIIFFGLFALSGIGLYFKTKRSVGLMIADDVARITTILQTINTTCRIIGFDRQQNIINFLNVGQFSGSEVGPVNLAYPQKWEGPYLTDNPTMQEKEYMVIKTHDGYFVTPGNGVRLPSGKIIGTDIILDEKVHIDALIKSGVLQFKGKALAAHLTIG